MLPAIFVVVAACDNQCAGPSCESAFPAGRLAVHRGGPGALAESDVWGDAWATVSGAESDGSDWAAVGDVWIGLPEAGAVAHLEVVAGEQGLVDAARTIGPTGYGGRLAWVDGEPWVGSPAVRQGIGRVQGAGRTIDGSAVGDRLGEVMADCGDLTGDGLSDVLVGVPGWSGSAATPGAEPLAGAVVLVRSDTDDALAAVGPLWWGTEAGGALGRAVACDVDLDGDGVRDLVAGAPFAGVDDRGVVFIVSGATIGSSPASIGAVATRVYTGSVQFGWAGSALATLDLTGTSDPELVVGAPGGDGAVLVYNPRSDDALPLATITGQGHLGRTLATGDLDADGRPDLLVGAPDLDLGRSHDVGRVDVVSFSAVWAETSAIGEVSAGSVVGSQPFQRVGGWIGVADVDGDGVTDLLLPTRAAAPE